MDVQKVIDIINNFHGFGAEENEAVDAAIQLLEKQVPKTPEISEVTRQRLFGDGEHDGYADWQEKCYVCPVCDSFLGYVTECDEKEYQCDYCSNCGQVIDWGAKESKEGEVRNTQEAAKKMTKMINDFFDKKDDTCNLICQLAEKLDAYERLGPIEELKEFKDKNTPMRPTETEGIFGNPTYECKNCGNELEVSKFSAVYCHWCGQKLDWSKHD